MWKEGGSLVIRVTRTPTLPHYRTKPIAGARISGQSEKVKHLSEKFKLDEGKVFLYMVTM